MTQELKPCPFCSGSAEMRVYDSEYFAQCIECFCSTSADHQQEADALAAWNRRPITVQPPGSDLDMTVGDKRNPFHNPAIADGYASGWNNRNSKVSRLLAENVVLQQRLNVADQRVDDLQSELTKAREALAGMVEYFPEGHSDGECFSVETAKAVLAHQSAPASKGKQS